LGCLARRVGVKIFALLWKTHGFPDLTLLKQTLAYPFLTGKLISGVHWKALKLWVKGIPFIIELRRELRTHRSAFR
jgi:DUF1365 family protein